MKTPYNRIIKKQCERNSAGTIHAFLRPNEDNGTAAGSSHEKKNSAILPADKPALQAKLALVSDSRVHVAPSNKTLAVLLAKLPGSVYDIKNNAWTFDIAHYEAVAAALSQNKVAFEKIPGGTLALARRRIPQEQFSLEGGIYTRLIGFQKDAVAFALNRNGRVLLADDMGLGKTIQAIAIAHYYRMEWPLLVIAPASLLASWVDAISDFLGEDASMVLRATDFGDRISVISYDLAVKHLEIIKMNDYSVIVCDECHHLKQITSKRTIGLLPVLQKASRIIMISGTPAESRPLELYPILCALDKSLYPFFTVYGNRYCGGKKIGDFYDYRGCTNAEELAIVMEKAFMVRRLKASVLGELPKKLRHQTLLDVPVQVSTTEEESSAMKEFANAAASKVGPVVEYLRGMVSRDTKTVVFAHHQVMLDGIEQFCRDAGVVYVRVDGTTPRPRRHAAVRSFQESDAVRMAILSIKACGTGLTLTAGKAAVFAELFWNPGTLLQAEDRIHRIGQKDDVEIHYLIGRGTIDEQVWPHVMKKMAVLESLGIGNDDFDCLQDSAGGKQTRMDSFVLRNAK